MKQDGVALRQQLGCWANERWRAELILRVPGLASVIGWDWMDLFNRHERIRNDARSGGRICDWRDSSPLTVARFFPEVGGRLLQHCLRRWPVSFAHSAQHEEQQPEVSFVIGVRGTGRLPQFLATVHSLLGQTGCPTEVIVVEQSWEREFEHLIPTGVRYVHTRTTCPEMPYNRSWALNVGAQHAKGRVVVLHDGDYVVPMGFATEVARVVSGKVQSARLARYIFYLDEANSRRVQEQQTFRKVTLVQKVVQNNPTPIAVTREAYLEIGGHDEAFYGWGGEDNEFIDRARTLDHCEGAFLPVFHLWHPEAPNRSGDRNGEKLRQIMSAGARSRINRLRNRRFGMMTPSVQWANNGYQTA